MLADRLNYILAIAEERNISAAARKLYVSQPTLTVYLNRLENELGVKLFDRSHTPISLTPAGVYYIEEMKKIEESEQKMRNSIRLVADPGRTLLIGIGQVRGANWLPQILPDFCSIHPDVNVQIVQAVESRQSTMLSNGKIDLAIGHLPLSVQNFEVYEFDEEPVCLCAHKKFGLVPSDVRDQYTPLHPYEIPVEALNGLPFIAPDVGNGSYEFYQESILNHGVVPSRIISINNQQTGFALTLQGLGVQLIAGAQLIEGSSDLDYLTVSGMPLSRSCCAAYTEGSQKAVLIRDFIRLIEQNLFSA